MSIFGKSFKRELGKNTAKRVSNAIFGDRWSTPYKRVNADSNLTQSTQARLAHEETQREKVELRKRQLELETIRQNEKRELKRRQIAAEADKNSVARAEAQRIKNAQIWELDNAVIKNVDAVIAIEIPTDENKIESLALKLCNQLSTEQWSKVNSRGEKSPEGAIRDKYVEALFQKLCQCILLLEKYPNNTSLPYLQEQKFLNEQKKRFAQLWPLGRDNNLVSSIVIPDSENSIVKLIEELQPKYLYGYDNAIRHKFIEALSALEKINPDNPKIHSAYKYQKKIIWKDRWDNNKRTWLWIGSVILVFYIIGIMCQTLGVPQQQRFGSILTTIIYSLVILIFVVYPVCMWLLRKAKLNSYRKKLTQSH